MADAVARMMTKTATANDRERVMRSLVESGPLHWEGVKRANEALDSTKPKKKSKKVR